MTENKSKSPARHESHCSICNHPRRAEIEEAFLFWESASQIAKQFKLTSRLVIYRHVRARGLMEQRNKNIRHAIAAFVERCSRVRPSAAAFVAASVALSKINAQGETVERIQTMNGLDDLFRKMTRGELLHYAESGELPVWFNKTLPDTVIREEEGLNE
jgi:hypothetical protein